MSLRLFALICYLIYATWMKNEKTWVHTNCIKWCSTGERIEFRSKDNYTYILINEYIMLNCIIYMLIISSDTNIFVEIACHFKLTFIYIVSDNFKEKFWQMVWFTFIVSKFVCYCIESDNTIIFEKTIIHYLFLRSEHYSAVMTVYLSLSHYALEYGLLDLVLILFYNNIYRISFYIDFSEYSC